MPINYVSDLAGNAIAVQIPIEEWNVLKEKYPNENVLQDEILPYQKKLIDERLQAIKNDPTRLRPIQELFDELDKVD